MTITMSHANVNGGYIIWVEVVIFLSSYKQSFLGAKPAWFAAINGISNSFIDLGEWSPSKSNP